MSGIDRDDDEEEDMELDVVEDKDVADFPVAILDVLLADFGSNRL